MKEEFDTYTLLKGTEAPELTTSAHACDFEGRSWLKRRGMFVFNHHNAVLLTFALLCHGGCFSDLGSMLFFFCGRFPSTTVYFE